MSQKTYDEQSIRSLKGPDQVRLRPGVIFGSDGIEGCRHGVFEILSNSVDESRAGYGNEITITYFLDGSIEIADKGRGIPIDFNEKEDKYNWELLFCTLYAGGKYDPDAGYDFSLGLNGLGLCATQFASEFMNVVSDNGKFNYKLSFSRGFNSATGAKIDLSNDEAALGFTKIKSKGKNRSGTKIRWKPDIDVFTDISISEEWLCEILTRQAVVNDGLKFILKIEITNNNFTEKIFCYENGIDDCLKQKIENDAICVPVLQSTEKIGRDREDKEDYRLKLRVAFSFSNKVNFTEHYHNSSFLEHGGSPDKALRSAFVYRFDRWLKDNNKYTKGESSIVYADIDDCLCFFSSNFSTKTSYENQTKKAVTNKFIFDAMNEWLRHILEFWFLENKADATKAAEQILINKRSRENAERTRLNLKKKLSGGTDLISRVQKFVDCRTKDPERRELYIVEGDSALGAVKLARNAEFQAVIPVRGKILNCLKASYDKIFKSEIITDLIRVLGCGVDLVGEKGMSKNIKEYGEFSIENLKFNKVVICTDADVDGYQIRTLILTMIYRLCPKLIYDGYVYIAESPLYEINQGKNTYFAYTEVEKIKILKSFEEQSIKKYVLQRSKGLGENEPDMMSLTTMNPATRRLIKVLPSEIDQTKSTFDLLLGDDLSGRKSYISAHGVKYLSELDVS